MNNTVKVKLCSAILLASSCAQATIEEQSLQHVYPRLLQFPNSLEKTKKEIQDIETQISRILHKDKEVAGLKKQKQHKIEGIQEQWRSLSEEMDTLEQNSIIKKEDMNVFATVKDYYASKKSQEHGWHLLPSWRINKWRTICPMCQSSSMLQYVISRAPSLEFLRYCSPSDLHYQDTRGNTPLQHVAMHHRKRNAMQELVKKGVSLTATNSQGENVLHCAVKPDGHTKTVHQRGKFHDHNPNYVSPGHEDVLNRSETVKLLLDTLKQQNPTDVITVLNAKSTSGRTPLTETLQTAWKASRIQISWRENNQDIARLWVQGNPVDKDRWDEEHDTWLKLIEYSDEYTNDMKPTIELLVAAGSDINDAIKWLRRKGKVYEKWKTECDKKLEELEKNGLRYSKEYENTLQLKETREEKVRKDDEYYDENGEKIDGWHAYRSKVKDLNKFIQDLKQQYGSPGTSAATDDDVPDTEITDKELKEFNF